MLTWSKTRGIEFEKWGELARAVRSGSRFCDQAEPAKVEIALEDRGILRRMRERDVAVGTHEVDGVASQSRERRAPRPGKGV